MTNYKNTFFSLALVLFSSIISFGQQWIPISNENPQTIQTWLVSSSEDEITVQLQVPGFYAIGVNTPQGQANVISVPKSVNTLQTGDPDLPMIAIPAIIGDDALMNVRVQSSKYIDFQIEVAPSKGDFPRSIDPATVPYTYGEAYNHDAFFPEVNARLYEPYILRDFRGQNLVAFPFAYNPVTKTLRVYHEMTLVMFKEGRGGDNCLLSRKGNTIKVDPDFRNIYENHFINYRQTLTRYTPVDEEGEMLIICHDAFMEAMTDFINWKHTRGIQTTLVAMSSIGSVATDIQGFVMEQYAANPNLTHVLLVGDDAQIPGTYFSAETTYNNWSGKGDNIYGQVAGGDLYNDLFVGRFSANTIPQLATQIERTIYYERDIDASATWLANGEGMAAYAGNYGHYSEDDYDHINLIRDDLLTYTYNTVYQDYADVNGYTCSAASISQHINDGVGILNYANHGNEQMWAVASYCNENVNALTNDNKLPFIWSVACKVGKYDNTYTDDGAGFTVGQEDDCLAEAWMHATNASTNAPTGAIGGMFSYISQPWQPPMYGQDEMVDILIESYDSNVKHTLGGTSINGIMTIIDQYGATDINAYATHQGWVLYGDPSLMLRTKEPAVMSVVHNGSIDPTATTYTVNVTGGEGALATITRNYEILGSAKVVNGVANIEITSPGADYQELTLCVFGFNKVTYLDTITVNTGSQYTISATANPYEGGSITGAGNYYENQNCTLTATPNVGFVFSNWTQGDDVVSITPTFSFTVNGDADFTANFIALVSHAIICTQDTLGGIFTDKATAFAGESVAIGAQPSNGYSFSSWSVLDADGNPISVIDNQFIMPDSDVTVSAVFVQGYSVCLAEVMYGGINANLIVANEGTNITLTATPDNGYVLDSWKVYKSDDVNTTVAVNGNSFTMPAYNVTVSAVFSLQPGGEISVGSGTATTYYLPTFESYRYSLSEQIYTPSEVGGAGTITSIAFYSSASKTITRSIDIYMKNTDKTEFTGSVDWENVSTLYRVFTGNVSFNTSGWTTINLTTPFEYDGTSNLLVCVDDHTGKGLDSYNRFYNYSTGSNRAIVTFRDGTAAYNPATATNYPGSRFTYNNQVKFTKSVTGCEESLSLSTGQLFGFRYVEGEGPSEAQHFSLIGANLTGDLTLMAPEHFEICQSENGDYTSSLVCSLSNNQVSSMVYVRLKADLNATRYLGEALTLTSGSISREVVLSGEVTGQEVPNVNVEQTIVLSAGYNWFSTNVDITLDELKDALMEALPGTNIIIKSQTQNTYYNPDNHRWSGSLTWDVTKMYVIWVGFGCVITLEGPPVDFAEHSVTFGYGANWFAYPLTESKSVSTIFSGFAIDGDVVRSQIGNASYRNGRWFGVLNLEPGMGYIYDSKAEETRSFCFPTR